MSCMRRIRADQSSLSALYAEAENRSRASADPDADSCSGPIPFDMRSRADCPRCPFDPRSVRAPDRSFTFWVGTCMSADHFAIWFAASASPTRLSAPTSPFAAADAAFTESAHATERHRDSRVMSPPAITCRPRMRGPRTVASRPVPSASDLHAQPEQFLPGEERGLLRGPEHLRGDREPEQGADRGPEPGDRVEEHVEPGGDPRDRFGDDRQRRRGRGEVPEQADQLADGVDDLRAEVVPELAEELLEGGPEPVLQLVEHGREPVVAGQAPEAAQDRTDERRQGLRAGDGVIEIRLDRRETLGGVDVVEEAVGLPSRSLTGGCSRRPARP
jgi:hypothetical protein